MNTETRYRCGNISALCAYRAYNAVVRVCGTIVRKCTRIIMSRIPDTCLCRLITRVTYSSHWSVQTNYVCHEFVTLVLNRLNSITTLFSFLSQLFSSYISPDIPSAHITPRSSFLVIYHQKTSFKNSFFASTLLLWLSLLPSKKLANSLSLFTFFTIWLINFILSLFSFQSKQLVTFICNAYSFHCQIITTIFYIVAMHCSFNSLYCMSWDIEFLG